MAKMNKWEGTGNRKVYINVLIVAVFVSLMMAFIHYFYRSEPDFEEVLLYQLGEQMQSNAVTAHWQWLAEGRPEMIMLVHYNADGKEIGRSPIRLTHSGLPAVKPGSNGCEKLWSSLLNQAMTVEGSRVHGEYYRGSMLNNKPVNARCRFRLSRGSYFDYYISRGEVEHEGD